MRIDLYYVYIKRLINDIPLYQKDFRQLQDLHITRNKVEIETNESESEEGGH